MIKHLKASPQHKFIYPILEWGVTDGDTLSLLMDMGFNASVKLNCRLLGIDTPEKNTYAGKLVMSIVNIWMESQSCLSVYSVKKDKFAERFLGVIFGPITIDTHSLQSYLTKEGLGRVYQGDARLPWSEEELRTVEQKASVLLEKLA